MKYGDLQPLKQESVSVGLFKNGYAFYVRQYSVEGDSTYLLDLPSTVHGTLSVSSPHKDVTVSTQYELVDVPAPLDAASLSRSKLQKSFAGKQVTLQLKDSTVTGTLVRLSQPESPSTPPSSSSMYEPYSSSEGGYSNDFLVLDDGQGGLMMIDPSSVLSFKVQGGASVMRPEKRLTVTVDGSHKGGSPIQVSYLAYGLTWAPSYSINLTDPLQLSINFQAQIRNQGKSIDAGDAQLITGFPNLQFQGVTSLLSSDLSTFTREVNNVDRNVPVRESIMAQSAMSNSAYGMLQNTESNQVDSDGSDVFYQSIGPLSLGPKAAVLKNVASATAAFQQVVDWDASEEDAWDAVRFLNPLPSAITTAPVSVVQGNRLLGQSSTKWTPPRGLAIVRSSKALSVRVWKSITQGDEVRLAPERAKIVQINVEGVLNVVNTRNTNITMCLNYEFDGILVPIRGINPPKVSKTEGGSGGLNPRTNVNWEMFMPAGAKANVTFYYTFKRQTY
jgi:hypothetical protein